LGFNTAKYNTNHTDNKEDAMKNVRKSIVTLFAGMFLGAALFSGGSVLAAEYLNVQRSNQKFFLDGEPVNIEAYNINGSNYMKMGDLSQMVGFDLAYDSATNSVYIGERPVKEVSPEGAIKLPEGDAKLNLKEGDKILCDDGYVYEITDMKRYNYSAFLGGPLPDLPPPPATGPGIRPWSCPRWRRGTLTATAGSTSSCETCMKPAGCSTPSTTRWGRSLWRGRTENASQNSSSPSPLNWRKTQARSGLGATLN